VESYTIFKLALNLTRRKAVVREIDKCTGDVHAHTTEEA
jgi:hypothetical protein